MLWKGLARPVRTAISSANRAVNSLISSLMAVKGTHHSTIRRGQEAIAYQLDVIDSLVNSDSSRSVMRVDLDLSNLNYMYNSTKGQATKLSS